MPIAPVFPAPGSGGGGGGDSIVTPPAATTQAVSSGGSPTAKTFGAFTDPDGVIDNYNATMVNAVGSTSASGSGLGAYTFSGSSDGDAFTLKLDARNSSNEILATAVHTVNIASAALAADGNNNSILTKTAAQSTSGSTVGTVTFRGNASAAGVSVGGTDAASFNASDNGDGTVTLTTASDLTAATRSITLTVGGYTTPDITITTTPDAQSQVVITTRDGYVIHRYNNGSFAAYALSGSPDLYLLYSIADVGINSSASSVAMIVPLASNVLISDNPSDSTSWVSTASGGGTNVASWYDSVNNFAIVGRNNNTIGYKSGSTITSDSLSFSSYVNVNLGWTGSGSESVLGGCVNPTTGANYASGWSSTGSAYVPHISRTPAAPSGTWTEATLTGFTSGSLLAIASDGTYVVAVGGSTYNSSSADGKVVWSNNDGTSWNVTTLSGSGDLRGVTHDGSGTWCAVGTSGIIYTSTNPSSGTWTSRTSGTSNNLWNVAYDTSAGEFLAVGENKTLLSSSNGTTWSAETVPSGPGSGATLAGIAANTFVQVT